MRSKMMSLPGDEACQKTLWGSQSLTNRNAKYFPQLANDDLHVFPEELDSFAEECQMVNEEAANIAVEVAPVWGGEEG